MVNLTTLRVIVGHLFNLMGITWALGDKIICSRFCANMCTVTQEQSCSFSILFIAIIFVICGYALIIVKDKQKISLKSKIKKNIKLTKKQSL